MQVDFEYDEDVNEYRSDDEMIKPRKVSVKGMHANEASSVEIADSSSESSKQLVLLDSNNDNIILKQESYKSKEHVLKCKEVEE